jgi:hypothetical protein
VPGCLGPGDGGLRSEEGTEGREEPVPVERVESVEDEPVEGGVAGRPPAVAEQHGETLRPAVKVAVGFKCPFQKCKHVLTTKNRLTRHTEVAHNKEATIPCPICQKLFVSIKILKKHKVQVHEKTFFACDECNLTKTTIDGLKRHKEAIHNEKKCTKCGEVFNTGLLYQKHNKSCGRKKKLFEKIVQDDQEEQDGLEAPLAGEQGEQEETDLEQVKKKKRVTVVPGVKSRRHKVVAVLTPGHPDIIKKI